MKNPYDDIIDLPHPVSQNHPPMPLHDRAAQFAPFAALTGFEAAIRETARKKAEESEAAPGNSVEQPLYYGKPSFLYGKQ